MKRYLISTITGERYPFEQINEFAQNGEPLEVKIEGLDTARVREGASVWERFADFLPFDTYRPELSLGEGDTPLIESRKLGAYVGLDTVWLKNETVNPTWSFKDRGSLTCTLMAKEMGDKAQATISTGNMGASVAAFAARANMRANIFIQPNCPTEKIQAMAIHGATIIKVAASDYSQIKLKLLSLADSLGLRIVSGNGPIRVEGYKSLAFELWEQCRGSVPDFIVVPTSACGNIRGIFKGFRELQEAGLLHKLPRMVIAQAASCSPLVSALRTGKRIPIPFAHPETIATAISAGNPTGGIEILHKAYQYNWLAEDATETEILEAQRRLAQTGIFVEPSSATSLVAVQKLRAAGKIQAHDKVVLVLTGSGLKDGSIFAGQQLPVIDSHVDTIEEDTQSFL